MNEDLIEYYKNLLIIQYKSLEKAPEHIKALITSAIIYDLIISVRDAYNIETATGVNQDVLSKYIGVDRVIYGMSFTRNYFGYTTYGTIAPFTYYSYAQYGVTSQDIQFRKYSESNVSLYSLNDAELRFIQKLKILKNNSNATTYDIDIFILNFFTGQALFFDNLNMTITYIFKTTQQRLVEIAISENLIPRPAGVGLLIHFVSDIDNIFGYNRYGMTKPDYIVGYAIYGQTTTGGMLEYGDIY